MMNGATQITAQNKALRQAKKAKKDEFYTQIGEIEKELDYYKSQFAGKVVYCNCDDPRVSKFFHYFSYSFEHLGLKKLITTCYKSNQPDYLSQNDSEEAIYIEYKRDENGHLIPYPEYMQSITGIYKGGRDENDVLELNDIGIGCLKGDGDFRSPECVALLKQADIVVTNPPFSLFREYVAQLVEHDKKFVIIGNINAVTYKEIFSLIKENKLWLGASIHSGDREFGIPDDYPLEAATCRVDSDGKKFIRVKGVRWFTNLDHRQRHEGIIPYKTYKGNEAEYPKYDNYDAIEVSKTNEIPKDYEGVMGVPVSFLDKYNPNQFEILGSDYEVKEGFLSEIVRPGWNGKTDRGYLSGKRMYARLLIKRK